MKKYMLVCFCFVLLSFFVSSCIHPHSSSFAYVTSLHQREDSPHKIQKIWIDSAFGEADMIAIHDAIDQWEFALNGYLVFEVKEFDPLNGSLDPLEEAQAGKAWAFLKIQGNNYLLKSHDHRNEGYVALAFTERVGGNLLYIVRDRLRNDQIMGITMHEMGHLLGAQHIDESDDLMNPVYDNENSRCIDKHTVQQVARSRGFPVADMNYCVYVYETTGRSE